MKMSAVILRLEGVLALTGDVYHDAMNEALDEAGFGHRISRSQFAETFGHNVGRELFLGYATRHLYPRKQTSDLRTLFEVTHKRLRQSAYEKLAVAKVAPGAGVVPLLRAARDAGLQVIVISVLPLETAQKLVARTLGDADAALVSRVIYQDTASPVGAFLEARSLVGGTAVVLESSTPGLAAAQSAGLPAVAVIGQSVLANGIYGARAVVDRLGDLLEEEDGEPDGWRLLIALDAIVANADVAVVARKIIDLRVRDVLAQKGGVVKSINPTDTVQFLAQRLLTCQIGAMVVIGDTGALEGIVSERDLARGVAEHGAAVLEMPVSSIMTRAVITCAPVDSIHNVAKVMTARRIRHLPVADGDRLVGLISIGDVLNRRMEEVRYQATVLRRSGRDGGVEPPGAARSPA